MRILVLGGTRFVGFHVVRRLHDLGHDVTIFHRGQTEADLPPAIRHIHGERRHLPGLVDIFRPLAPEVVLDVAPMAERDAQLTMRTFRGIARRVVALSSIDVYRAYGVLHGIEPGPADPAPLSEDAPLREKLYPYRGERPRPPDDPQRWQDTYEKRLVEQVVMSDPALPGTILRLPFVYGPRDYQHRSFPFLKRMDDGRPAILMDEARASFRATWGYVENVADAIVLTITDERAVGRTYNVGEASIAWAEWVRGLGQAAGWRGQVVVVPREDLPIHLHYGENLTDHLVADTTRIRRELGYAELVPRAEGLQQTVAWERAHPPEQIDAQSYDYAAEDATLAKVGWGSS